MPSGRRGSIERYIPPRRSGGGSGTEQDSPTKSTGNEYFGDGSGGITDWSAALDLEDELDSLNLGEPKGADYWNDQELSSWADQVDAMSPKEEKSEPRFSEPPPQIPNQSAPRNNYTNQNNQRVNNLPPRFQHQNKSDNYTNNGYNQQHQNREPRDQDWYQKLGRGRGRGAPVRPPAGAGRPPPGGNQTMAQRLLSSRHQTRQEDVAQTNGHSGTRPFDRNQGRHENGESNGYNGTRGETNGYNGTRGETNGYNGTRGETNGYNGTRGETNGYNGSRGETNGYNGTRRFSDSQDEDKLSEASYSSSRKQGSNKPGGGDLRDRLNKKKKDVNRSLNYEQDSESQRSNQSHSTERSYNNTHQNNHERSFNTASHNDHDNRVDSFVKGIRQSEERRYENGHSFRDGGGDRATSRSHDKGRGNHDNGRGNHEANRGKTRNGHGQQLQRPKKNTENFNPSYEAPEMRILFAPPGRSKYTREVSNRDVLIVSDLFCDETDFRIYDCLLDELENSGVPENKLWQLWHGDSHVIADDKRTKWRESCPTFNMIIEKIQNYFDMDIKATRLNWYRDTSEWKPFHHDAAAMKPDKARTQNFTVAVSFGVERDAAFEHAQSKNVISMPQPNGTIYTFSKDVNIIWRHGILQMPPEKQTNDGRISIIAWGWIPQFDL